LEVFRIKNQPDEKLLIGQGSFYIPSNPKSRSILEKASIDLGLSVVSVSKRPSGLSAKLSSRRIAIWDMYGGSISAGWLKWIMEQHNFAFNTIYPKEINSGELRKKYDIIIFVSGAIPPLNPSRQTSSRDTAGMIDIPAEFRSRLGKISADTSISELKKFMESGGTVVTIGNSANIAYHLKIAVSNSLVDLESGKPVPLPPEKFFIPGSVMRVRVDTVQSSAWGMQPVTDIFFDSSPVFRISPEAVSQMKVEPLAWFDSDKSLRSGWAWGQQYLKDGVAAFVAEVGQGKLYCFGPEITFRSQTYGTFKFIFNQLYSGY
jgi:hypothetical protein